MSKILLFSDLHCHTHKNSLRRLQHCLDVLEWVFKTAIERGIKSVVFLGDLFQDREKIQVFTYQKTYEIINKYAGGDNPQIKLYLLVGNHDMWFADNTDISSVYPFDAISNVEVIKQPIVKTIEGLNIAFIPFTLNPVHSLEVLSVCGARILCGHLAISGAQLNTLYKTHSDVSVEYEGDMIEIGTELFVHWEHVFLGHYHGAQQLEHAEYIGSPLQLNFAEVFQKKHIIELDTETLEKHYIENTFSPRHLIINESEIEKYDLKNSFVRIIPKDLSSFDIAQVKNHLLTEKQVLTLEFEAPPKDDEEVKIQIENIQQIVSQNKDQLLQQYMKSAGTAGLDFDRLFGVGKYIIQKNLIE